VALVQEQHVALLEHDQNGSQVTWLLDGRCGQFVEAAACSAAMIAARVVLPRPGPPIEDNVLQGGGALVGGVEHQPQRLFQVAWPMKSSSVLGRKFRSSEIELFVWVVIKTYLRFGI